LSARDLLYGADGRLRATWRIIAFVVIVSVGTGLAQWIVLLFAGGVQAVTAEPFDTTSLAYTLALLGATAFMLASIDHRPWSYVRLGAGAWRARPLLAGTAIGALAISLPTLVLMAAGWMRAVPWAEGSWWAAALRLTPFFLVAALWEELAFRGYLFSACEDLLGRRGAVVATSALFGLAHALNPGAAVLPVLIVAGAGAFLAGVMLATRSLAAAWLAHVAFNWMQSVAFHSPVSGSVLPTPDYRVVDAGPDWATGGSWGPEGGLAALGGMIVGLMILTKTRARPERREERER